MDKLRPLVALAVLAALALLAGGWFLLIAPERSEAAALREQGEVQLATNAQQRTQLEVLRNKAKALPDKERELAEVATKIPTDPRLPALLRALSAAGRSAGVQVQTVTPGAPAPVTAPADAAAPPAAGATAGALSAIPLSIQVAGGFAEVEQFVAELEELPRALRITGLNVAPGGDTAGGAAVAQGRSLSSTITGSVFLAPAAPAPEAAAAPVPAPVTATAVDPSAPAS